MTEQAQKKPEERRARRVLVIEDNLDHAVTSVLLLRDLGYEVHSALNGGAGLAAARTFRPDVVLLDVGLPDSTGWDVARQLKEEHPQIRVVAITGLTGDGDRERSIAAGCEAHILKPVAPQMYERIVAGTLPASEEISSK